MVLMNEEWSHHPILYQTFIYQWFPYYNYQFMVSLSILHEKMNNFFFPNHHITSLHHPHFQFNFLSYFRLFSLLYLTGIYFWYLVTTKSIFYHIKYVTMEGYFLSWIYFLLLIQDYLINGFGKWGRAFPLSPNLKYYIEVIYEVAFCIQVPITIIFWAFLFPLLIQSQKATTSLILMNVNLHVGPLLCLAIDFIFNTFQFRICHFWIVAIFSTLYIILNIVYSFTVKVIYPPIDWVSTKSYILILTAYGLAFVTQLFGRLIFMKVKKRNLERCMMEGLVKGENQKSLQIQKDWEKDMEDMNMQGQNSLPSSCFSQQL